MPNWKRVIVSGSDAALTSVTATAGFTGSLFGTASYATNALSASYAPDTTFPYTGSAIITGSLAHAEGANTTATGDYSHAEGDRTTATGDYSHAEGGGTQTGTQLAYDSGISSGIVTINSSYDDVSGDFSANDTLLIYDDPFDANYGKITTQISQSLFNGTNTIVELYDISITTTQAYVGDITQGILNWTGNQTIPGEGSHAEGGGTTAIGYSSHAEGASTTAITRRRC
jgi:trimeric autotransporter adhesin